jgi:enoyl-CoA hydratase/carnithine racemase
MSDRVTVSVVDGVADVRLNRPEKLNALDAAMFDGLSDTGRRLAEDRTIRAVVLSGEGRAFCAGLDFMSFFAGEGGDPTRNLLARDAGAVANQAQRAAWVWTTLPMPVIAAVHGIAYGGGLQIALAADIRFSTPDAQWSVMEMKWGLIPDMSGSVTLSRVVGIDVAKELTFTARVFSGTDAHAYRMVTHLTPTPHEGAIALAREIAGKSPSAVRVAKQLFNETYYGDATPDMLREERLQRTLIGKSNQMEAVQANLARRPPAFEDPD